MSRRCCFPTTGSPCSSPARARPTAATRRAPATGRRPRAGTGPTCSVSSATRSTGTPRSRPCSARPRRQGSGRRSVPSSAPGTGDNMAAALGLGLRPGDLALSLGTSGTAYTVSDRRQCRSDGARRRVRRRDRPLPPPGVHAERNEGHRHDRAPARRGHRAVRPARARRRRPGADGVVLVPYFDGERTPNRPERHRHDHRACVPTSRRRRLARAAVEGVVCNLLEGADALVPDHRRPTAASSSSAVARTARRTAGSWPTSPVARWSSRPTASSSPAAPRLQAAAVLHGAAFDGRRRRVAPRLGRGRSSPTRVDGPPSRFAPPSPTRVERKRGDDVD